MEKNKRRYGYSRIRGDTGHHRRILAVMVVLGIAAPLMGQEKSEEEIIAFLEENELTYPVLMDSDWELFNGYGIYSFPTTFMIDPEGNVYGYVSGQLSYDMMESIIKQTREGWNQQQ